jgi:hypothetical protein
MRQVRHAALQAVTRHPWVACATRWLDARRMLLPAARRGRELARPASADTAHALVDAGRRARPAEVLQPWQDARGAPPQGQVSALAW